MLTSDDKELVLRDSTIPGLATLLDNAAMLALLQEKLPDQRLSDFQATYLRYKPGTNCLAGFSLNLNGRPILGYAKVLSAQSPLRSSNMQALERDDDASDFSAIPPLLVLVKERMVVHFFPSDNELPALRMLSDRQKQAKLMRRLLPNKLLIGATCSAKELEPRYDFSLEDLSLAPLCYKPERRYVALASAYGEPAFVLKCYNAKDHARVSHIAKYLTSARTLKIAKRIGHSARHRIVAYEYLPGTILAEAALRNNAASHFHRVGIALRELHSLKASKLDETTLEKTANDLQAAVAAIGAIAPEKHSSAARTAANIIQHLEARDQAKPVPITPIHGDLHLGQIVLSEKTVGFIDFDRAARSDPAQDIGNLLASLHQNELAGQLHQDHLHVLASALLEGYENDASEHDEGLLERSQIYAAAFLLRAAVDPFRRRRTCWQDESAAILQRAAGLLDTLPTERMASTHLHNGASRSNSPFSETTRLNTAQHNTPDSPRDFKIQTLEDPAMPFLKEACTIEIAEHELRDALSTTLSTTHRLVSISNRRHKKGRRCLLEYRWQDENAYGTSEVRILGKIRAKKLDKQSFANQSTLWNGAFGPSTKDKLFVPEPLATIPKWHIWFQRHVPGSMVRDILNDFDTATTSHRVIEAINKLHHHPLQGLKHHSIADEMAILHKMLEATMRSSPRWTKAIREVLIRSDAIAQTLEGNFQATIHRDFYADQVLVTDKELYLLDFDLCAIGDPALDIGNFCGHLIEQGIREADNPKLYENWYSSLYTKFEQIAGSSALFRAKQYAQLTLARHIAISRRIAGREGTTDGLIHHCLHPSFNRSE